MELRIKKDSLIKDLQSDFNACFPYLKIEFFKSSQAVTQTKPKEMKVGGDQVLGKLSNMNSSIAIKLSGKETVTQLIRDFNDRLGLSIKLYRKCGNLWIETTLTENWTLSKQNTEGELLTKPLTHGNETNDSSVDDEHWLEVE